MADPASILGTAVGVTSLGIQACQALSQYYSHFRSFDNDIKAIIQRLDGLCRSLETLESLRSKVEDRHNAVSSNLQQAIEACASGLSDLQEMADKCGQQTLPVTVQDKTRALKKRFLWPIRHDTLTGLAITLNALQANVQLALQLLDIEVGHRAFQSLDARNCALIAQVERAHNDQIQALTSIQQGFTALYRGHLGGSEATKLVDHSLQMCSQLDNAEKKSDLLLVIGDGHPTQVGSTRKVDRPAKSSSTCTCRKKRRTALWRLGFGGLFDIEVTKETEHKPACDFYQHGSTTFAFQTDYKLLRQLLKLEIKTGVSYMRTSGLYSIQPTLTVRPIVSRDSPTFAPIYTLNRRLGCTCLVTTLYCRRCVSSTRAHLDLQIALNEIIQSFRSGKASPYDTTENGLSVLNLAYNLAFQMIDNCHLDGLTACRLLDDFVNAGHFRQHKGLTDVRFGFETIWFTPGVYKQLEHAYLVYAHRIRIADVWTDGAYSDHRATSAFKYRLLQSEDNLSKYDNECTLKTALYKRSKSALHKAMDLHSGELCGANAACAFGVLGSNLLFAGRHWPDGLKTLLCSPPLCHHPPLDDIIDNGTLEQVIKNVFEEVNYETLHVLAHLDVRAYWIAWEYICEVWNRNTAWDLSTSRDYIRTMYERMSTQEATAILDTSDSKGKIASPSFFHAPNLNLTSMQLLLEAGFRHIDEPADFWTQGMHHFGTPLWIQTFHIFFTWYPYPVSVDWALLELMISSGARLEWEHPVLLTTPAHLIGLALNMPPYLDKESSPSLVRRVLLSEHLDHCSCACSVSGCVVIGCAASSLFAADMHDTLLDDRYEDYSKHIRTRFDAICDVVELKPSKRTQFALCVLRVLTFDELGLSHTCCRRVASQEFFWYRSEFDFRQDPADIDAIRYSEGKDLLLLDVLMDRLENTWTTFSGTFLTFLRLVWLPLMRETHDELSARSNIDTVSRMGQADVFDWSTRSSGVSDETGPFDDENEEKLLWRLIQGTKSENGLTCNSEETSIPSTDPCQEIENSSTFGGASQPPQHAFDAHQANMVPSISNEPMKSKRRRSI